MKKQKPQLEILPFESNSSVNFGVFQREGNRLVLKRTRWAGACFLAKMFPDLIKTFDYPQEAGKKIKPSQQYLLDVAFQEFTQSQINDIVSYSQDPERGVDHPGSWIDQPTEYTWKIPHLDGSVEEHHHNYGHHEGWGTSIKTGIEMIMESKISDFVKRVFPLNEKKYYVERALASNNIHAIEVKNLKMKKVCGGTAIWSYTKLTKIAKSMGYTVTIDDLRKSSIPVIKDGQMVVKASTFRSLWDEYQIQRDRNMSRPPKVVVMPKSWSANVMKDQWILRELTPLVFGERLQKLARFLEDFYRIDPGTGKRLFFEYVLRPNTLLTEDSIGQRLIKADPLCQYMPFVSGDEMMDRLRELIFQVITTGNPDSPGFVLCALSNPEKSYTKENIETGNFALPDEWEDNLQRIILPSGQAKFSDVLDTGENAVNRYPIDSPLAGQVGLTFTTGFLPDLLSKIRGFQHQMLCKGTDDKWFFAKGDATVIPDELWPFGDVEIVMDSEDVKSVEGLTTEENYTALKKETGISVISGYIGSKQLYGIGCLGWVSMNLAHGFNADFDGDGCCLDSGKTNPITVAAKRLTVETYKDELSNPKLKKYFTLGDTLETFASSLLGHIVVGVWTNISVIIKNMTGIDVDEIAKKLDVESMYSYLSGQGFMIRRDDFTLRQKLFAVIATGIKVGTDCYKTKVDLKYWASNGQRVMMILRKDPLAERHFWLIKYNPAKETSIAYSCGMNVGLPIEESNIKDPQSLPDMIAKTLLHTGLLNENGEWILDDQGRIALLDIDDTHLIMYPLTFYRGWVIPPQSDIETRVVDALYRTNTALMKTFDFSTPNSFLNYWETVWGDVCQRALDGYVPNGISVLFQETTGKEIFGIRQYIRYDGDPISKQRLAELLWWRFFNISKHSWKSCAAVMWSFPDECVEIATKKPGLRTNALSSQDGMLIRQRVIDVALSTNKAHHYLGVNINEPFDVYVLSKRKEEPVYKIDWSTGERALDKAGNEKIKSYCYLYRTIIVPAKRFEDVNIPKSILDKEMRDLDIYPPQYVLTDLNSEWLVDDQSGQAVNGRYRCILVLKKDVEGRNERMYARLEKQ